jgi:MATE family multidrug resistance protein
MHFFCDYLAFAVCAAILASLGEREMAAHQITVVVNRLAYHPGLALGEVACILVGQALGARRLDMADRAVRSALKVAIIFMVVCGAAFALSSGPIAGFFTSDPSIASRTTHALWVAGMFQILDAINIVMRGALRGAKDVRFASFVGVCILWACVPTVTYGLGRLAGWGVVGGWVSFMVATGLSAVFFTQRWRRGQWRLSMTATTGLVAVRP